MIGLQRAQFLLGFLLLAIGLAHAQGGGADSKTVNYKEDVIQDLRKKNDLSPEFALVGGAAVQYAVHEQEGLHINLPAKRDATAAVGLQAKFKVSGDFEITGAYELLAADAPVKPQNVVGVNMFIMQGPDGKRFARLGRSGTAQDHVYVVGHNDPEQKAKAQRFPTTEKGGQLRLVRAGSTLIYLVKDGTTDGKFKEIFKAEKFGTDELTVVRFVVTTEDKPLTADARLLELRIRSGGQVADAPTVAPEKPGEPKTAETAKTSASRGWLIAALLIGVALVVMLAVVIGVWLLMRRAAAKPPEPPGAKDKRKK
jgi:Protein of unknown function (DUF1583)